MKIRNTIKTIFALSIAILMANCETEKFAADEYDNQAKTISTSKVWFKEYEANGKNFDLVQNLKYDWDGATITKSEDGTETIIVPINELKKDQRDFWEQRLYIYKTSKEDYKALVYEIYTNKNVEPESQSIDGGNFTGFISVWDLKTGFVRAARFENNQVVENGIVEVLDYRQRSSANKAPVEAPCTYADFGDGGCGGKSNGDTATPLRPVIVTAPSKGAPVEYYGPRGPVIGGTTPGGYTSPGGGGGNSGGGITAPTPEEIVAGLEKQINSDKLNPCQKEVLEMLKNATNADIAAMLNKLGATTNYTVTFYSETTINGTPAATQRVSQYNYKIQLSTDYTGATKLFRAGNILHELGHAYFMSLKDDYSSTTPPNAAVFDNYPFLFQGYVEKKFPNMYDAHHIEMANQYVDAIAQTLQEYNRSADPNGIIPYQVYVDLAWGGLQGTPTFEEKFKVGTPERLRIENRYAAEQTGTAVGYSNGQLQNTVGKPCN